MHQFPSDRDDWPVRFILDSPAWRAGYDLAMEWAVEGRDAANPFDPDRPEFYGFEEGRLDAGKLRCVNEAKRPA
jgi:hypothetical protein